jgi:two-component system response regulator FixJ
MRLADAPRSTVHLVEAPSEGRAALARRLRRAGLVVHEHEGLDALAAALRADGEGCLLLDAGEGAMPALALQRALRARGLRLPTIFVAREACLRECVAAMREGALDYVERNGPPEQLLAAVQAALAAVAGRRLADRHRAEALRRLGQLTPRERDVLEAVVDGGRNAQIAARLGVTTQTVKAHRSRAMAKLGCATPAELVRLWWVAAGEGATPEVGAPPLADARWSA